MDPDATLNEALEAANAVLDDEDLFYPDNLGADATRLAEAVQNLHVWLTASGSLPKVWQH